MADLSQYDWNADPAAVLADPNNAKQTDDSASVLGDLALAIPRGAVGAVQDAYGLVDTIAGDSLPDWTDNPLGESETIPGSILQGISNFAAGFVPIFGQVSKIGGLSKFGKYAIAGALTDFTVWDGNEARLSNLLREHVGLEDPVTEFLAADENDPEIVGRLKNALEGLGVGTAVDLLALSIRGVKKYRSKVSSGASKEVAAREAAAEIKAEEFQAAYTKAQEAPSPATAEVPTQAAPVEETPAAAAVEAPDPTAQLHGQLRSLGIDPSTISVEEIQKGISVRARQFENAGIDPAVNPRNLSEAELAITVLQENGLNLRDVRDSKDAALVARTVETLLPLKKGTTWEQVQKDAAALADSYGEDPRKLILELQGIGQDYNLLNRKLTVARAVYDTQLRTLAEMADELRTKGGTPEAKAEVAIRFQQIIPLQQALDTARSGLGLGLGSLRHDLGSSIISREMADKLLIEAGGEANVDRILHALGDAFKLGGPGAVSKIAKETVGKKLWNISYEVWMQGILSAPRTGVVSATSAGIATYWRPLEMMIGGALRGDGASVHAAFAQLQNIKEILPDAWKAAQSSWLTEQNKLGAGLVDVDRRALTAANLGLESSPYAGMIDTVGRFVRTPGRILSAQDEGFGLLNYRAIVKERLDTQYLAEAAANGSSIQDALARSQNDLDRMVIDGQAYGATALYKEGYAKAKSFNPAGNAQTWKQAAREYVARELNTPQGKRMSVLAKDAMATVQRDVTMTSPLSVHSDNKMVSSAARLQGLLEANPGLKIFLPFVRTPTNIAVWAGQRFDVIGAAKVLRAEIFPEYVPKLAQSKNRYVQDMLSNDPTRKAAAVGRIFTGVAIGATVTTLAMNGAITGRGPKDPNLRKILEASGWQPYSVKIGDTYYSYARIDPLATLLGTFADTYEWSKWAPEEDRGTAATLGWGLAVGMANNVTNKTYFTGLMRLTEVLSDPAAAVEKTARGYAGSAIPNFLASIVPALGDDYMREARTMTDAMLKKIPGYSDDLAPQRNLLGEPVEWKRVLGDDVTGDFAISFSPIATSAVSDDLIWQELSGLERAFEPPRRMRSGMDLTTFKNANGQDAYDRWQELSGKVSVRGLNLRNALRKLIKSPRYQALPAESSWEAQSPRVYEIKNVLEQYRSAAFTKVLSEFPDLAAEDRRVYLTKRDLKRGIDRRLLENP